MTSIGNARTTGGPRSKSKPYPPTVTDLEAMVVAVRTGDIAATAQELDIPKPAVIRRLRKLEMRVAIKLFTGVPKSVGLTPAGREMLPLATAAYEQLAALERFVEAHADENLADAARTSPL